MTDDEASPCQCCTFGNHTEPCTCNGEGCCHPDRHRTVAPHDQISQSPPRERISPWNPGT